MNLILSDHERLRNEDEVDTIAVEMDIIQEAGEGMRTSKAEEMDIIRAVDMFESGHHEIVGLVMEEADAVATAEVVEIVVGVVVVKDLVVGMEAQDLACIESSG